MQKEMTIQGVGTSADDYMFQATGRGLLLVEAMTSNTKRKMQFLGILEELELYHGLQTKFQAEWEHMGAAQENTLGFVQTVYFYNNQAIS